MKSRYDPLLPLSIAAVTSKTSHICTAVNNRPPRSPMVVTNSFWDPQKPPEGRSILGLEPQMKSHNQNRFSVKWSAPVPSMRRNIAALRGIFSYRTELPVQHGGLSFRRPITVAA